MRRLPSAVFFALFAVSGFAGLIYESIWSHYLKLFLGHAAYAQTLVLAIFMGGMAIGSWLVSRYTHRLRNLLLGYAGAEFGIGLLAIIFHRVFVTTTGWAYESVLPSLGGVAIDSFRWLLASVLILPGSILLGTTFPLMSAGVIRLYPESQGRSLSMLYFTNSLGAAVGVLVSGFYLIDRFGLPGTILTAGVFNIALAITVWAITRRIEIVSPSQAPQLAAGSEERGFARAILILACVTGAASFIYEVTWIRMLTMALGASTHSFEVMLAAFILGMSLGALWIRGRLQRSTEDSGWLAAIVLAKAAFAVYAVWIFDDVLGFIEWVMNGTARTDAGYVMMTVDGFLASAAVMLPTAICAGATLPIATHALTSRGHGESAIGRVYAANTAGCILGAAFATHVGMPLLGIKGLTGLGAALDLAAAALIFMFAPLTARRRGVFATVGVVVVAGLGLFLVARMDLLRMSSGVYRTGSFIPHDASHVEFYRDGKTATIAVITTQSRKSIRTNGKPDASIQLDPGKPASGDEPTQSLAGTLPLVLMPKAQSAAVVGLGSGLTTHALLGSPVLRTVDTIEIEPMVVEGAKLFDPNNQRAYRDPRSHIFIDDAKSFFAARTSHYDIIVSEPSNPWVSGVATLFSEEFYARAKHHLNPGGLLVQWIQAYEINVDLVSSILQALGRQFPDYAVYSVGGDMLVVATPQGRLPPLDDAVFSFPDAGAELRRLGFIELGDLKALRIGDRKFLEPLLVQSGFPANSDFFPILDQRAPRSRFKNENADPLRLLRETLTPIAAVLDEEWRTPVSRLSTVSLNYPIRVEEARIAAAGLRTFATGDAGGSGAPPEELAKVALLGHGLSDNCRGAEERWLQAVTELARLASPVLEAKELGAALDRATKSRCAASLNEIGRDRLRLLVAINNRDGDAMSQIAMRLIDSGPAAERAYYILTAITGHLAKGRRDEARLVAERSFQKLSPTERDDLATRLVMGHAFLRATPAQAMQ